MRQVIQLVAIKRDWIRVTEFKISQRLPKGDEAGRAQSISRIRRCDLCMLSSEGEREHRYRTVFHSGGVVQLQPHWRESWNRVDGFCWCVQRCGCFLSDVGRK